MNSDLNFDATVLTSELMEKINSPITIKKKSSKTIDDVSKSRLVTNVKVKDLIIDLSYQRTPNREKVSKIIRDFDPNALGVIICSCRENGDVAVIDGGHRVAALNSMGLGNNDIRCLVFFDLTLEQEAEMFTMLNDNRTKPKTQDILRSKIIAKDKDAVEIAEILEKHGLRMVNSPANNGIRAAGTISTIHKKHGKKVLDDTIFCLKSSFDSHSTNFSDQALLAVSSVIGFYNSKGILDLNRLITTLKPYGNASFWLSNGSVVSRQIGMSKSYHGMIFILVGDYNKRLKKNKLDFNEIIK